MAPRSAWLFALVLGAVLPGGCYQTPKPDCGFTCGAGGACPTDYTCHEDNRCRLTSLGSAPCQAVFDARVNDARPVDSGPDAAVDATVDATVDALPPADAGPCEGDLAVPGAETSLVLSEVSAGSYIELYNDSAVTITLDQASQFGLQSGGATVFLSSATPANLAIPAHSYRTLDWPGVFGATDVGGELALFRDAGSAADFNDGSKLLGYFCWGTGGGGPHTTFATTAGTWSGTCTAAPTRHSVQRRLGVAGTSKADYDIDRFPTPNNCTP